MGKNCNVCGEYRPIIQTITHHLGPARKADEVVAFILGCGHRVGGKEFDAYESRRKELISAAIEEKNQIDNDLQGELTALLGTIIKDRK